MGAESGGLAYGLDGEKNADVELMGCLNTGSKSGSGQQPVVLPFDNRPQFTVDGSVPTLTTLGPQNPMSVVCTTGHVTHALTHEGADASEDGTGRGTPIVARMVAFGEYATDGTARTIKQRDYKDATDLVVGGRPRRLTPKECERLMSWPDDHTRYGTKGDGTVYELSDTARYRLCGNGVGSVCVQWIAERLAAAITGAMGVAA